MSRRIAIFNRKGGVGKSTTAANLAVGLARVGKRVLLVDYDDQADACAFLGMADKPYEPNIFNAAHLTRGLRPFEPVKNVLGTGLDVVVAMKVEEMQELETELATNRGEGRRTLALAMKAIQDQYDFIIVDCPPTLNVLVEAALAACDLVLIPVGMEGGMMKASLDVMNRVKAGMTANPQLRVLGILPTHYDMRTKDSRECLQLIRTIFKELVLDSRIHRAESIKAACKNGVPVVLSNPRVRAAKEYKALVEEVIRRGN